MDDHCIRSGVKIRFGWCGMRLAGYNLARMSAMLASLLGYGFKGVSEPPPNGRAGPLASKKQSILLTHGNTQIRARSKPLIRPKNRSE